MEERKRRICEDTDIDMYLLGRKRDYGKLEGLVGRQFHPTMLDSAMSMTENRAPTSLNFRLSGNNESEGQ